MHNPGYSSPSSSIFGAFFHPDQKACEVPVGFLGPRTPACVSGRAGSSGPPISPGAAKSSQDFVDNFVDILSLVRRKPHGCWGPTECLSKWQGQKIHMNQSPEDFVGLSCARATPAIFAAPHQMSCA